MRVKSETLVSAVPTQSYSGRNAAACRQSGKTVLQLLYSLLGTRRCHGAEKPEIDARIRKQLASKRNDKARGLDVQTLGQRIRAAREALGASQVELAAAAGISQGYLSQLETDEREPTLTIAGRLAKALRISLDELASGAT